MCVNVRSQGSWRVCWPLGRESALESRGPGLSCSKLYSLNGVIKPTICYISTSKANTLLFFVEKI